MLSRRQFLIRSSAAGATLVLAPEAAGATRLLKGGRFASGVMSGDPTPRGITLWTHLDGVGGRGAIRLEVARDKDFRNVVMRRTLQTRGSRDHTVKARLGGLRPHERYYYRFETATRKSPVGRFQTALPDDSREPVRLGFFSCQNYPHGYFNAHALMAREDLDFVVNLGDYIYAEAYHSRADGTGVRDDRIGRERAERDPRGDHARRLPRQVQALPQGPGPAEAARALPARLHLGRPRGPEQLRRRGARRRPAAGGALHRGPAARGLQGLLRAHAALRGAARPRPPLPHAALRPQRRPDHARRAPVPRRPALRRRRRAALPRVQQPAHAARPGPEGVLQDPRSSSRPRPGS